MSENKKELLQTLNPLLEAKLHQPVDDIILMVVDLAESTPRLYKSDSPESVPVMSMVAHNCIAANVVHGYGGRVLKLLGDGVFAEWRISSEYNLSLNAARACQAAIDISNCIDRFSREHGDLKMACHIGIHCGRGYVCNYKEALNKLLKHAGSKDYFPCEDGSDQSYMMVSEDDPHGLAPAVVARVAGWAKAGQILLSGDFAKIARPGAKQYSFSEASAVPLKGLGRFPVVELAVSANRHLGIRQQTFDSTDALVEVVKDVKILHETALMLHQWKVNPGDPVAQLHHHFSKSSVKYVDQSCIWFPTIRVNICETLAKWKSGNVNDKIGMLERIVLRLKEKPIGDNAKAKLSSMEEPIKNFKEEWKIANPTSASAWSFINSPSITKTKEICDRLHKLAAVCLHAFDLGRDLAETSDRIIVTLMNNVKEF